MRKKQQKRPQKNKKSKSVTLTTIAWNAMIRYGFSPRFSKSVIREAEAQRIYGDSKIDDLSDLLWSSIDNVDSQDLDQIAYATGTLDGEIEVKIAIADVDQYVRKNSYTDRHASHNTTSVYTGVITFPMLPECLSYGVSSLLPEDKRPAIIINYTVLPDGSVRYGEIDRAYVSNKAKLVYEQIGEWLSGGPIPEKVKGVDGLTEQILLQNEAAKRLRKRRMEQGALNLETIEAEIVIRKGVVRDIIFQNTNQARYLIEEFMVAANETVANFLAGRNLPLIHRIVKQPKYWDDIVTLAASYDVKLPADPDAKALTAFLSARKEVDPERFPDLSLAVVKLIGSGEYVAYMPGTEPVGHFALSVINYTHSTAPNRRYTDLIIQRIVKAALQKKQTPYSFTELEEISDWISQRERDSKKVERFMLKASAAMLLQNRLGETYQAMVTGASKKGAYARLLTMPVEGKIVLHDKHLKVGDKIKVKLIGTDPFAGHLDFERLQD